jgi:PAS domain S-box-containing protein
MRQVSRAGALLVAVAGLVALIGWYGGVSVLTTMHPGSVTMTPNAALALVLLAVAVLTLGRRRVTLPLGAAASALGAVTLGESLLLGGSSQVDGLLPGIDLHGDSPTMAPATALAFLLLGIAVIAGTLGTGTVMRGITLVSFGISQVTLLGYLYGVAELYSVGSSTPMAPSTAGCLAVLSLSLLLQNPSAGLVGLLRSDGSARKMLRPLMPFLLLGPLLLGRLFLYAQDQGWFGARFGVVAFVMTMTVLGCGVSWLAALRLHELDRERDLALQRLAETNSTLDSTVRERTRELADRQSYTDAMLETVDVGILWCDADSLDHHRNGAGRAMFGLGDASLGMQSDEVAPLVDVLDAKGRHLTFEQYPLKRTLLGEDIGAADMRVGPRGGPYREVVATGNQILSADGGVLGAVVVLTDVTAERTASRALEDERRGLADAQKAAQRAEAFLDAVLAATPDFTFVTQVATGAVIYVSRDLGILGISADQLDELGAEGAAALVHPEDQGRLFAINLAAADLEDGQVLQLHYRARHTEGRWLWVSRRVTPFRRDSSGEVVEILGVIRDISELVEAESRLTHAALHDDLTGLPNRALLIERLEAALARSARDGREIAVLFCDLDGFKRVNDIAGHAAGDTLLLEISQRFTEVMREFDTVARVGGDEFVMIVEPWNRADTPNQRASSEPGLDPASSEPGFAADRAIAIQVAERVAVILEKPFTIKGIDHVVSASIGITYATAAAGGPTGRAHAEQVVQDADAAMYLAKRRGKDRFEVFDRGLSTDLAEHGRVEQLLRQALRLHGVSRAEPEGAGTQQGAPTFAAAYQPVFEGDSGKLTSFEALARLTDADGVDVPPEVFIPIAEETGMIHQLGRTMLGLACGQLETWRAETPGLEDVSMAVNVSALQAQHVSLATDVRGALSAHRLDPCDLVLELTETALLQVADSTIMALRTLRVEGVGIAIDDFGIGYASLRYLATLPVSAVKIDRSFTGGLPGDQTSRKIVQAVAGLAADMDLICIVEGVETAEQRAALPKGVYVQGFLTGRPQKPETVDILALLDQGPLPASAQPATCSATRAARAMRG